MRLCLAIALVIPVIAGHPLEGRARPGWLGRVTQSVKQKVRHLRQQRRTIRRLKKIDPLLAKAYRARKHAHAPYSNVRMGAALLVRRGGLLGKIPGLRHRVITGFNSESKGDLQICAERAAMACLPRGKAGKNPVLKLAVVGQRTVPTPCGRCLQVLEEVGSPRTEVVAANLRGKHQTFLLKDLLPARFPTATPDKLAPHQQLIDRAVTTYQASVKHRISRYRPAYGAAVKTSTGKTYWGMVIKDTASTFTPATQIPLDLVAQDNVIRDRSAEVKTVVFAGKGHSGPDRLPVPTADERQHLVDMNPDATVVLYNPKNQKGAVLQAKDLLPYAYRRRSAAAP
jgi:cytidine deaminase